MLLINCTGEESNVKNCSIVDSNLTIEIIFYFILFISIIGTALNSVTVFIFIFSNDMNTKFLRYLKWYIINSLIVTTNYLVLFTFFALDSGSPFGNEHKFFNYHMFTTYQFIFVIRYFFIPIWAMSYTNGNLLDIAIAYERILIYLPKMKFMRKIKIYINLIVIFAISFVLNLPSLLTRNIGTSTLNFSSDIHLKWHIYQLFLMARHLMFFFIFLFFFEIY
jgi:hypothetical protein